MTASPSLMQEAADAAVKAVRLIGQYGVNLETRVSACERLLRSFEIRITALEVKPGATAREASELLATIRSACQSLLGQHQEGRHG